MKLLAVDLGLRSGLALFGADGKLIWYRSHNFGSAARLRDGASAILREIAELRWLVIEGGGDLALIWEREARRMGLEFRQINAETWRNVLLYQREQRSGAQAKQHADDLARRIILWSGARKPTSLRHDAAEAILIGLWGVLESRWLPSIPNELRGKAPPRDA